MAALAEEPGSAQGTRKLGHNQIPVLGDAMPSSVSTRYTCDPHVHMHTHKTNLTKGERSKGVKAHL